jgi:hypothetical protein
VVHGLMHERHLYAKKVVARKRGGAMHLDLEVSSAVTIDIAFDQEKSNLAQNMQFASFVMEFPSDELEVLVAAPRTVGVDAG